MSCTVQQLFYAGHSYAGMVNLEQTDLAPEQEEEARQIYNSMVNGWRADGYLVSHLKRNLFDTVPNKADYTIGSAGDGADWDHTWPDRVDRASIVLTSQANSPEYAMAVLTVDEYKAWIVKTQTTNWPYALWYERAGPPLGIVHLLFVPTDINQVALYLEEPLDELEGSDGILDLAPAYQEALETNLARRILMRRPQASSLDADAKAELRNMARNGMELIRNANIRPLARTTDLTPGVGARPYVLFGNRYTS